MYLDDLDEWMTQITNNRMDVGGIDEVDEEREFVYLSLSRAQVIPKNQGHITEVPNPSLVDVLAGLLTLSQGHINVVCLCQTDPMGPRIVPILPGQGHIWLLTLWVSLTQRESLVIWTISFDKPGAQENRSSLSESHKSSHM